MIHAIRINERVAPDGVLTLHLPDFSGANVEVIVLARDAAMATETLATETLATETLAATRLQEQTGFVRLVLADPAEDVWNDL
jgi:hypothetical protein